MDGGRPAGYIKDSIVQLTFQQLCTRTSPPAMPCWRCCCAARHRCAIGHHTTTGTTGEHVTRPPARPSATMPVPCTMKRCTICTICTMFEEKRMKETRPGWPAKDRLANLQNANSPMPVQRQYHQHTDWHLLTLTLLLSSDTYHRHHLYYRWSVINNNSV